ncbi:VP1 [Hirame aquareovirus]|nr:VP1 [Hirame aquareovirus]
MTTVFGIQLTSRLNTATVRRPPNLLRYDSYITTFTTPTGVSSTFRPIDFNSLTHSATVLQTYPPLSAWVPSPQAIPTDLELYQWREWITDRFRQLAILLQQHHPLVPNASSLVNPIVIGLITSAFLNSESISPYVSYLFLPRHAPGLLTSLVSIDKEFTRDTYSKAGALYTPAGVKYLTLYGYDPIKPTTPCTYGKHIPGYATVIFYSDVSSRLDALHSSRGDQPILEHFDQPTYAPHLLVPRLGSPTGYGSSSPTQSALLLGEGLIDSFRQNASAGPSTAVARVDQTYHPVMNIDPTDTKTLIGRLTNLSLLVTQGCQSVSTYAQDPDMATVNDFLAKVMSPGEPQRLIPYTPDFKYIMRQSPFPIDGNPMYLPLFRATDFIIGTTTGVPDVDFPLRFLPQYRNATVPIQAALDSFNEQKLSPIVVHHGYAVTGGCYFTSRNITGDPQYPWPVARLPDIPRDYFALEKRQRRELFSRLRSPGDRSLVKDTANFNFLATLLNPVSSQPMLDQGFSMAYLGAASTHHDELQPLIIRQLLDGLVPGVPVPSRIVQLGYDSVNGSLLDATRHSPTGTFGLVYSDVDQVEDAGTRMDLADRAALATIATALQMTTMGGVTLIKINFPSRDFWTQLFHQFATSSLTLHVLKPLIVNSIEVFLVFGGRVNNGNLQCSSSLHQFLTTMYARNQAVHDAMGSIPLLGQPDDGTSSLGIVACRQFNADLQDVRITSDVQSLAYLLSRIVPSSSYLSRQSFDGPTAITFYGKRTFVSERRASRLTDIPLPITTTIAHQSRFTGPPTFNLFGTKAAPVTQLVAAAYNQIISLVTEDVVGMRLLDLGTGPEARILSIVPDNVHLTMVDTRPASESMGAFDPAFYVYERDDYTRPGFWAGRQSDAISAIFTLGAAAAATQVTLLDLIRNLLPQMIASGARRLWLQMNAPLAGTSDLDDLIRVDTRRELYIFNGGQRTEPYALPDRILQEVLAIVPNATCSWTTTNDSLGWLEYVIGLGSPVDLDSISIMRAYSTYTPILTIDLTQPPMVVPVPLVVGVAGVMNVAAPSNLYGVIGTIGGVTVLDASAAGVTSTLGPTNAIWDPIASSWRITLTPNQAGTLHVTVTDDSVIFLNRGSTHIALPPPTIQVTFPANPDFTVTGNDAQIQCHPYYRLGVFTNNSGSFNPVNPERASVEVLNNQRSLHYVHDLSDNHVLFYLCDITDTVVGGNIAHPLGHIFNIVFPRNVPVRASPPYFGASASLTVNGAPFLVLDPLPTVLPPNVIISPLSTAIQPGKPTVILPPGAYGYVIG